MRHEWVLEHEGLTACKNIFGPGRMCLSLEEVTSWKSRQISAGAGMGRSREDTRPEGGRANQDGLEDTGREIECNLPIMGVHGVRRRRDLSSALCLEGSEGGSVVKNHLPMQETWVDP